MKSKLSLILAAVLLVTTMTFLSACGAKTTSAEDLKGKTIGIGTWGGNDAEVAALDKMIADFTAKSGIKVNKKVYTDYNTQIKTDLAGGVAPDCFYVDAFMAPYFIEEGVLAEIKQADVQADKFYSPLVKAFMKDNKLYAVAKDYSTLALYYNKKYVSDSELPKTQEELYSEAYLKKIQEKLPKGVIAMTYNADMARLLDIMQAGGKDVTRENGQSNLSDPGIIDNLKMIFDAAKDKRILTPADLGKGWNGEALGNELCAMMIEGNWVLGFLQQNYPKLDFGVVEIPTYKGKKTSITFTVGYAVNAQAKEPAAALEFVKYACGTEGMKTWCSGAGVLPSRSDVAEAMGVAGDAKKAPHVAAAAYSIPWQKGITLDVINKAFQNYFGSAVKRDITLQEAMKKADDEVANQVK